ncbi:MAG: high-affinity branched-chain amino acid ABC transporter ATP-binding protein LivG [Verrucomicrobia bacterium]|nr:MAG: high-affinity branched-chain amino acid ABC transporter ATP-binding protein LivG [Verrucomicrobiota bacterium]
MSEKNLLEVQNCVLRFGGLYAVAGISFQVKRGELLGLIGPNGAGKSSVFNLVTGIYPPTSGAIIFEGTVCSGRRANEIAALGIARTFQNVRLFHSLSVLENVIVSFNLHLSHTWLHAVTRGPKFLREEANMRQRAMELLRIFGLNTVADRPASSLPYGSQRRLEIVRAIATEPKLLMLDEPAAGMNPVEKEELMKLIRFIQERFEITVLLVEHDMPLVMGICQRIVVMEQGKLLAEGTPREIQESSVVVEAYLGRPVHKKPHNA